jgi:hypothetical protein
MGRRESTPRILLPGLITLLAIATPNAANAQWEAGCHGGPTFSKHAKNGSAALPAAGTPLTTVTGLPSRRVASWFFGDGAVLLNQVSAARGSATITALDTVLNTSTVQRQNAGSFGCHVSRQINPRYTAEFTIDDSRSQLTMSDVALAGIEASRASFISAFSAPLPAGQGGMVPVASVTAIATIDKPRGHQLLTTGVVHINLRTAGKTIPYATVGGGVVVNRGDTPSVTLIGNYRFTSPPGAPNAGTLAHDETDTVTVRYSIARRAFVGVVGGGIMYSVTPHWGVRLDVRAHLSSNAISNRLDAHASVPILPSAAVRVLGANPAVQFSASTVASPSLSGSPIDGFQTFKGSGTQVQVHIAPGFFWRF